MIYIRDFSIMPQDMRMLKSITCGIMENNAERKNALQSKMKNNPHPKNYK